jgi:hypothetical protein
MPETSTNTSAFCVASTRFSARAKPIPVSSRKVSVTLENELPRGGQPRADGGAPEIDDAQPLLAFVNAPAVTVHRLSIRPHLAPQGRQHRILQLGPADLDDMREALLSGLKGFLQSNHASFQLRATATTAASFKAVG